MPTCENKAITKWKVCPGGNTYHVTLTLARQCNLINPKVGFSSPMFYIYLLSSGCYFKRRLLFQVISNTISLPQLNNGGNTPHCIQHGNEQGGCHYNIQHRHSVAIPSIVQKEYDYRDGSYYSIHPIKTPI